MEQNPYIAPQASLNTAPIEDPRPPSATDISETELTAFTGKGRYPALLMRRLEGKSRHAGFNAWAAVFAIQWYFYRKLYLFGLLAAALEFSLPVGSLLIVQYAIAPGNRTAAFMVGILSFLMARIVIGYMANIALCLKADKSIRKIDHMNLDNEAHLRQIALAGGVSVPSLLIIYAALGVLRML